MRFVDREKEMAALESVYRQPQAALYVVYGRRRVGKTTLLAEFCKDKPAIYFLATEENIRANCDSFRQTAADTLGNSLLGAAAGADWEAVFKAIADSLPAQKLVIVLDEFQYLGKADGAFPSMFQRIWDTCLSEQNVMVILCGSLIHMMQQQTLSYESPLYGRRAGQIRLGQIPYAHYRSFFPDMAERERVEYYSVTGGIPKYIELFHTGTDIYDAIEKNVLQRQSFLYEEPVFLLQHEVQDIGSYFSIIRAVAAGHRRLSDIAASLNLKATSLPKPLNTLCELDILEREVPVTELRPETSKRGQYRIKDNYLAFWFRFIYPMRSFIESGHPEIVLQRIREGFVPNHASYVYEDICRQQMWDLNAAGKLPFLFDRVGRWWGGRDTEIDIVAIDSHDPGNILFGECKFHQSVPMQAEVLYHLMEKVPAVPWGNAGRKEWFILFSASGYSEELKKMSLKNGNIMLI